MDETQELEQQQITQENSTSSNEATVPEDEPEIALSEDGELKFRDDFYGYDEDEQTQEQQSGQDGREVSRSTEQPVYYTQEELSAIPFEQWDKAKLPKEVAGCYDAVAAQIAQRQQAAQRQQQIRNTPLPDFLGEAPKPFTPKELAQAAREAAMKSLNIQNAEDFEPDYNEEQRAALDMARMNLLQQRQYETAVYNQRAGEMRDLMDFNQRVVAMPDFREFNQWYQDTLKKVGKSEQEVNAALYQIAQQQGGHAVMRQVSNWYQMYKAEAAKKNPMPAPQPRKRVSPQTLESSRGGDSVSSSRSGFDGKAFSRMTPEQQQQAFIDMGLV